MQTATSDDKNLYMSNLIWHLVAILNNDNSVLTYPLTPPLRNDFKKNI